MLFVNDKLRMFLTDKIDLTVFEDFSAGLIISISKQAQQILHQNLSLNNRCIHHFFRKLLFLEISTFLEGLIFMK